ncbi:MAG TPA: hypothetical protein VJ306_16895 [Pyrinomonadaceae bacterium]|jgi:hypothetical protein|nr:hypothetical protein [Pyrinomonadaceae bacterium]
MDSFITYTRLLCADWQILLTKTNLNASGDGAYMALKFLGAE